MPTDDRPWLIVIAASAGGVLALRQLLAGLPADTPAAVVILQHRSPTQPSILNSILARRAKMPVVLAREGELIEPGVVYVARPDLHLTVVPGGRFEYVDGTKVRGVRSSANPLLETAAAVYGDRAIAVVLTGSGMDGTDGVQTVKARGGIVIAQDPDTAEYQSMPRSAVRTGAVDHVLPLDAIPAALVAITQGQPIDGAAAT
jgi:two-component system chemotaxis response regulator CheB